ncbi:MULTISPECIES: hypothetical protein [Neobacillus]|uniref:Uncharacterized protein n=1 Tax=Neobacillus rhizophilus TaxID=2833579 RepID=A0A942UB25_9BACI|nr:MULTISPECIES: hypothetical protein [Neobacillus]MBS4214879.1 hypothetical protein [Neobacillus rhizophilus]MBU8918885.1 hypothetical protein [Bacillus sp. FJAT-29953]
MGKTTDFTFAGNIHVQTMERQCGIFIGEQNTAIGWSAHGKQNSVFGSIGGQSNLLLCNTSILIDPDIVDTPIDDRDIHIALENSSDENNLTNLNLNSVNVNSMQPGSSVFVGKGHVNGIDANQKENTNHGNLNGNNIQLMGNINLTNDQDTIDAVMDDRDIKIAIIEKEL